MLKFIDYNHPGFIYSGEQAHLNGLAWLGGCSVPISDADALILIQTKLGKGDEPWIFRSAPAFWSDNDDKPD